MAVTYVRNAHVIRAGALAGTGFTKSLMVADGAVVAEADFGAVKIAVLGASALSAAIGAFVLWRASRAVAER